jgi:hypothetical protein
MFNVFVFGAGIVLGFVTRGIYYEIQEFERIEQDDD